MINKDFFSALNDLEQEKKINKETFIQMLETALTSAYKKHIGEAKSASVKLIPEKNMIRIYSYKTVVDEVTDPDKEISLEDAKAYKKSIKVGEVITQEESTKDFGRIAAQTAKQVLMQKLRENERQKTVDELTEKEDELLTSIVKRVENGVVYVNIGGLNSEGVMMENDVIPGETFKTGDRVKVYVKKIKDSYMGPQVQVSRTNIGFIRKLFELEVPEIASGDVVIKNIAREPGVRTKISVMATRPNIDAVGACLGNHSSRINNILAEIGNEKIDLVEYSDDPILYIARSLSPAKIISVETNDSLLSSRVVVPEDKLSLVIGKKGVNVKLAARLTGWKIDVKPGASETTSPDYNYELTDINENTFDDIQEFDDIIE